MDNALVQLGYLSTSLEGLLTNWALVIDAGPVGNEGRFANHTDDPNAVLAIGFSNGIRVRVVKAVKKISPGEEITVHYGGSYWETLHTNRQKTPVSAEDKSGTRKKAASAKPVTRDLTTQYTYFDGIVPDWSGSGLPGPLLLQILGEAGTSAEVFDMQKNLARKGLRVEQCAPDHPAYPGNMLVAAREFGPGEEICLYAGILSRMPASQLKLNESDYISSVCSMTSGAYGFELDDIHAGEGMVFRKIQHELPSITPKAPNGSCIPNADPPADLSMIEDIRGIGIECTRAITSNLQDPAQRQTMVRLLKKLRNLNDKNWKTNACIEIRRAFPTKKPTLTVTPHSPIPSEDPIEPETAPSTGHSEENSDPGNIDCGPPPAKRLMLEASRPRDVFQTYINLN